MDRAVEVGADIISDSSGANDSKILEIAAEAELPYIFNSFANQDQIFRFTGSFSNSNSIEKVFSDNLRKRINLCNKKGILDSNIAVDMNLKLYNKQFREMLIKNLNNITKEFGNFMISETGDSEAMEENINYFVKSGVNILKCDSIEDSEKVFGYTN